MFEDEKVSETLLDVIANEKRSVFIIAETEKYAHVTYFFRGKVDIELAHETRVLVPSVKAKNYINYPEMSAPTITKHLLESLQKDPAYFYLVNYANCDMVGHSGDFSATVKACECIDQQLKVLYDEVVEKQNGTIFVVGDHGNAEEMIDPATEKSKTSHSLNPVPFMIINKERKSAGFRKNLKKTYSLSHVAPTILHFLGVSVPKVMEQDSVF